MSVALETGNLLSKELLHWSAFLSRCKQSCFELKRHYKRLHSFFARTAEAERSYYFSDKLRLKSFKDDTGYLFIYLFW